MTTIKYDDTGTINAVKLLQKIDSFDKYIMLYTEIDSHIEVGDTVFITLGVDIGDLPDGSITLDNQQVSSLNDDYLYSVELQGYNILYVDKNKNIVVIDKLVDDILGDDEFITDKILSEHYISKVSCNEINITSASIDSSLFKTVLINEVQTGVVDWIQGIVFGGDIYNITIGDKYESNYITQNAQTSIINNNIVVDYYFTLNNYSNGKSEGYSYFFDMDLISSCDVENGNFINCKFANESEEREISHGYFEISDMYNCVINGGYHKDIVDLVDCKWNYGYFDCDINTGYSFKLSDWNDGVFVNGLFGVRDDSTLPIWHNGIFNNGVWDSYLWENGTFNDGVFGTNGSIGTQNLNINEFETSFGITLRDSEGITIKKIDGTLVGDIKNYEYTKFKRGTVNGGVLLRTKFERFSIGNGTLIDCVLDNVVMEDALILDSIIKSGDLNGGNIISYAKKVVIDNSNIGSVYITYMLHDNGIVNKDLSDYYSDNVSSTELVNNIVTSYNSLPINGQNDGLDVYITNSNLLSPYIKDNVDSINKSIHIGMQQSIQGGEYFNINFNVPQLISITTDRCNNCKFSVYDNNGHVQSDKTNTNFVLGSVRPIKAKIPGSSVLVEKVMLDFHGYDNILKIETTNIDLYDFVYLPLNERGDNTSIDNSLTKDILTGYENPKEFVLPGSYKILSGVTNNSVMIDKDYEDYMFGDFGLIFTSKFGNNIGSYTIEGGIYNGCRFMGTDTIPVNIEYGIFNGSKLIDGVDATFYGGCNINGGNFNNILVDKNLPVDVSGGVEPIPQNVWYGGNFNSGKFGNSSDKEAEHDEVILWKDNLRHYTVLTNSDENYDNALDLSNSTEGYTLSSLYPLVITNAKRNESRFDKLYGLEYTEGYLDGVYTDFYIDVWNESGLDNEKDIAYSDDSSEIDIVEQEVRYIVPSHIVLTMTFETKEKYTNMSRFLDKSFDISLADIDGFEKDGDGRYKSFIEKFNKKYTEDDDSITYVNNYEYTNVQTIKDTRSGTGENPRIAIIFKMYDIYNRVNNVTEDFFKAYNNEYKNVWSEANSAYNVKPLPVYDEIESDYYPISTIEDIEFTQDYNEYPTPIGDDYNYTRGWIEGSIAPPWYFDNNGIVWYPYENPVEGSIGDDYYKYLQGNYDRFGNAYTAHINNNGEYLSFMKNLDTDQKAAKDSYYFLTENIEDETGSFVSKMDNMYNNYNSNNVSERYFDKVDDYSNFRSLKSNLEIYKNGWEPYITAPFNSDFNNVEFNDVSYVYCTSQMNADDISIGEYFHIREYKDIEIINGDKYGYYKNNDTSKILVDEYTVEVATGYDSDNKRVGFKRRGGSDRIGNVYGQAFKVEPLSFVLSGSSIEITNMTGISFKLSNGSEVFITGTTTDQDGKYYVMGQPTIVTNIIRVSSTSDGSNEVVITSEGLIYGLDEWEIDVTNDLDGLSDEYFHRADIATSDDESYIAGNYNGEIIPTNKMYNPWRDGSPIFVTSDELNHTKNGRYEEKVLKIKRIVEDWNGIYLFGNDNIEDYNNPDTYLVGNDNPGFQQYYLYGNDEDYVLEGNDVEFVNIGDSQVNLYKTGDGLTNRIIKGRVLSSPIILAFDKVTREYKMETNGNIDENLTPQTDIPVPSYFIDFENGKEAVGYYTNIDDDNIYFDSYMDSGITGNGAGTLYVVTDIKMNGGEQGYGNILSITDYIKDENPARAITVSLNTGQFNNINLLVFNFNTNSTSYYNNNKTFDLASMKDKIVRYKLDNSEEIYTGTIYQLDQSSLSISITDTLTDIYQDVKNAYVYIKPDFGDIGTTYKNLDASSYPGNDGDPSKAILNSPKHILRELNEVLQTDSNKYERQAGIIIRSFGLESNDESASKNIFNSGNFYSGNFYSTWNDGNWFANDESFEGISNYNQRFGLDITDAPPRKYSTIKNMNEIIDTLKKRGEYYDSPTDDNRGKTSKNIVKAPHTRSDEL